MSDLENIKKTVLHYGKSDSNLENGCKVLFHMKVQKTTVDSLVLDDTRKWGEPMELLIGKKFKLEILEACIKTMKKSEIAAFIIDRKLLSSYPIVAKTMRDFHRKKQGEKLEEKPRQCCGMGMKEGLGYADLDELLSNPQSLQFTIELLTVDGAGSYEKEFWSMTEEEQKLSVGKLKSEANNLYKQGSHKEACKLYAEAVGRLENLMLKEKPKDEEWNVLNEQKLPILLNFCQCKLLQGEYYSVIEHCTTVLEHDSDNIKALFRRGKAHFAVHNITEAIEDIKKAASLDPSISRLCNTLLNDIDDYRKKTDKSDKQTYKMMLS